jgi:hypothetical protein
LVPLFTGTVVAPLDGTVADPTVVGGGLALLPPELHPANVAHAHTAALAAKKRRTVMTSFSEQFVSE